MPERKGYASIKPFNAAAHSEAVPMIGNIALAMVATFVVLHLAGTIANSIVR